MAKDPKDTKENKSPDAPNPDSAVGTAETAPKKEPEAKAVPKKITKVLHVVAKREGFRRAGFVFGAERTRLVVDDLTAEQIKQLKQESMLVVTESESVVEV